LYEFTSPTEQRQPLIILRTLTNGLNGSRNNNDNNNYLHDLDSVTSAKHTHTHTNIRHVLVLIDTTETLRTNRKSKNHICNIHAPFYGSVLQSACNMKPSCISSMLTFLLQCQTAKASAQIHVGNLVSPAKKNMLSLSVVLTSEACNLYDDLLHVAVTAFTNAACHGQWAQYVTLPSQRAPYIQ